MDSRELPASPATVWSIPQALILLDRSERKVARGPGKTEERRRKFLGPGSRILGADRQVDPSPFHFGKPISLRWGKEAWNPTVKRASISLPLIMGKRGNATRLCHRPAMGPPRAKLGNPLAFPGIALSP